MPFDWYAVVDSKMLTRSCSIQLSYRDMVYNYTFIHYSNSIFLSSQSRKVYSRMWLDWYAVVDSKMLTRSCSIQLSYRDMVYNYTFIYQIGRFYFNTYFLFEQYGTMWNNSKVKGGIFPFVLAFLLIFLKNYKFILNFVLIQL
jgi:hypothetical protein